MEEPYNTTMKLYKGASIPSLEAGNYQIMEVNYRDGFSVIIADDSYGNTVEIPVTFFIQHSTVYNDFCKMLREDFDKEVFDGFTNSVLDKTFHYEDGRFSMIDPDGVVRPICGKHEWRTAMVQKQGNRYVTSAIHNENHEWIIVTTDHTLTQERWMDEQKQELLHSLAHMETSCLAIAHMGFDQAIEEIKQMSRLAVRDITIIYI